MNADRPDAPHSPPHVRLFDRAKGILLQPSTEWVLIEAEPATLGSIFKCYVLLLAAIPAIGAALGMLIIAGAAGASFLGYVLRLALALYVTSLLTVSLLGFTITALASYFGGVGDVTRAFKLASYSFTPLWVSGIILAIVPEQILVWSILGFLYGAYLLYLGVPALIGVPEDKWLPYAGTAILAWLILFFIARSITGTVVGVL
jgi:hypothetical protein